MRFVTSGDLDIPALTADQMKEVDRIAVDEFGINILQMMENAGRNLAQTVLSMFPDNSSRVTILAGSGGNGGGGICCARHLLNRGYTVKIILTKDGSEFEGAAKTQLNIIQESGFSESNFSDLQNACDQADLIIDSIIGYSLHGKPTGHALQMIQACNNSKANILSLDIPTGIDSTTGETQGEFVKANTTLTLALPKIGSANPAVGNLLLGDIGIPPQLYKRIGVETGNIFSGEYIIPISVI